MTVFWLSVVGGGLGGAVLYALPGLERWAKSSNEKP